MDMTPLTPEEMREALQWDSADRWTPTAEQDREADLAIRTQIRNVAEGHVLPTQRERGGMTPCVFTVLLLIGKTRGAWNLAVRVEPVSGIHWTRDEAYAAAEGALSVYQLLRSGSAVSASVTRHSYRGPGAAPVPPAYRGQAVASWLTTWTISEA